MAQKEEINNEAIKDNLEDAVKQSKKLLEKLGDYKDKLRQKKSLDWQTKKDLEKMTEQQKKLQEQFEDAKRSWRKI
ncbi:MAG: hypothetical protein IPI96_02570 [Saprospiraceae bacterium]|nr:hypothetical protein [Saprospiraceae bacterium]